MPGIYQFINEDVHISDLKEVEIQDLLGRDPIKVNLADIMGYVTDKVVMVTEMCIRDRNCTKGDAMKRAVAYLGGDMKDTIAFGDSMNDFQMISEAAYGVVSYLAPDKLKAIADDTFEEPDDDGIFKCLQRLGLI